MRKLMHILPFMESEELKELAIKVINKEIKGVKLIILLPFLRRDDLNEIVDKLIENKQGKELSYAIPFVSTKTIERIYQGVKSGEIEGVKPTLLYPFLDKDKLKELFNDLVQAATDNPDSEDDELDMEEYELEVESEVEKVENIEVPEAPETSKK
ncbi:MAG: hypothetical protein KAU02_04190 [Tenericutes bacterium]|nr:hypothetical protein [Mycoplasmatota bacterium]